MAGDWLEGLAAHAEALGVSWGPGSGDKLRRYVELVLEHNSKTNLTAASTPEEIARRHLADAFSAVPVLKRCLAEVPRPEIVDVGAGAGFIGIGVQIAWPGSRVTLLESAHRKFLFLNWAGVALGLPARAVWRRAEKGRPRKGSPPSSGGPSGWGPPGGFDAALARALAPLDELLPVCLPLLRRGGYLLAYLSQPEVDDKARIQLGRSSGDLYCMEAYRLPGETRQRHLGVFRKA